MRTCKTKLLLTSVVLVWSICTHVFAYESKDPNSIVYGLFAVQGKTTTYDTISRKCFAGLSLTSCVLTNIYEGRGSSVLEATQVRRSSSFSFYFLNFFPANPLIWKSCGIYLPSSSISIPFFMYFLLPFFIFVFGL